MLTRTEAYGISGRLSERIASECLRHPCIRRDDAWEDGNRCGEAE